MVDISREGNEQFAGECYDRDAADPAALGANTLAEPTAESTGGLVSHPHPGKLDHCGTQTWISCFRDAGIVTETGSGERNRVGCRHGPAQLSPPSVPGRDHPARDLALYPVHPELPRCRGAAGRARARHLLRNGTALGAEVRSLDRATAAPASPAAERSLAS